MFSLKMGLLSISIYFTVRSLWSTVSIVAKDLSILVADSFKFWISWICSLFIFYDDLRTCLFNNFPLKMQECGPRFTLKLISLQHGTFDTKGGEYEWVHKVIYLFTNSVLLFQFLGLVDFVKHFSCIPTHCLSFYFPPVNFSLLAGNGHKPKEVFPMTLFGSVAFWTSFLLELVFIRWGGLVIMKSLQSFNIFLNNARVFFGTEVLSSPCNWSVLTSNLYGGWERENKFTCFL